MTTFLAYVDESGDDGFPSYSSPIFVLSTIYLRATDWREVLDGLVEFRRRMKSAFGLPVKTEFHSRQFLLNKKPYRELQLDDATRIDVISHYCDVLAQLSIRVVNVGILKPRIAQNGYDVLDWAVKMGVQRVENDLRSANAPDARFVIISDEGRVAKMARTTRRLQRFNPISSHFGASYRQELNRLIEDPLPKRSDRSFFIQSADLLAFITHLHLTRETGIGSIHGRMPTLADATCVTRWLQRLLPVLNTRANSSHPFGIKLHPT